MPIHFTYLLLAGAWHGAWCWERVAALLRSAGHTVLTPDLPGQGQDLTPHEAVTFDSTVERLVELVDEQHGPVILVAHSLAGVWASHIAASRPGKIVSILYLSALIPHHGESARQVASRAQARELAAYVEEEKHSVRVSFEAWPLFYHDCAPEDLEVARQSLRPQPLLPLIDPVSLPAYYWEVSRSYIGCLDDRVIPPARQAEMARQVDCSPVWWMESGHSPFFSHPGQLASVLQLLPAMYPQQDRHARWF